MSSKGRVDLRRAAAKPIPDFIAGYRSPGDSARRLVRSLDSSSRRVWRCSDCGKEGVWRKGWSWYGSYKDADANTLRGVFCPRCSDVRGVSQSSADDDGEEAEL